MKIYKGKINFGDKEYECEVINGIRYVEGKTVSKFIENLIENSDENTLRLLQDKGMRELGLKKTVIN